MRKRALLVAMLSVALVLQTTGGQAADKPDRMVLPVPAPTFHGKIGTFLKDPKPDFPKQIQAPAGAPNALIIILDDVGFGHAGAFGGAVATSTMDRIASIGLRYNTFHTAALCSPTRAQNGMRTRFHHVIDIAPTVLEAAGIPEPKTFNGVKQKPIEGVSMLYSIDNEKAKSRRTVPYFEMFGNRGIYKDGWMATTRHGRLPRQTCECETLSQRQGSGERPCRQYGSVPLRSGTI